MKKLSLIVAALLCSYLMNAQKFPQRLRPAEANGFFMFDPLGIEFENAKIEVIKTTEDPNGGYVASVLKELQLGSKNYVHIPKEYVNDPINPSDHYSYHLKAFNSNGEIVIDDTYEGLCDDCFSELICSWTCIGDDYTWKVGKYSGNTPSLMLEPGPVSYIYMSSDFFYTTFQQWVNINGLGYYGCSDCSTVNGFDVINASGYQGNTWFPPGTVGVKKGLGPWKDDLFQYITLSDLSYPICNSDKGLIADFFETYGSLSVPLVCHPATSGNGGGVSWGNPGNCFGELVDLSEDSWIDCIEELASDLMTGEVGSGVGTGGIGYPFEDVVISHWDGIHPTPVVHFGNSDVVYSNGEVIIPTIILDPGLYNIQIVDKNGKSHFGMADCKNGLVHNKGEAQYVSTTAYPVPIENDKFDLTIESLAKVKFQYTVKSFDGNILFQQEIQQEGGLQKTYPIVFVNPEGNKFLLNILKFEDGSIKSFTTQVN